MVYKKIYNVEKWNELQKSDESVRRGSGFRGEKNGMG